MGLLNYREGSLKLSLLLLVILKLFFLFLGRDRTFFYSGIEISTSVMLDYILYY